jgi:hypothetical protein
VLYVCIPVHNEAATVGVLLWRLRTVLGETGRDYEVVVYDDGSTDATADVLAPYERVLPLTRLGGPDAPRRGRSAATEALVRHVVAHSRYPRRDACVVLQGDFTDRAEDLPGLLTAFDAGADVVVGRRPPDVAQPHAERRLRRMGPWVLRPLVRVDAVDDLLTSLRLFRVAVLRDLLRAHGDAPVIDAPGWAGVVQLLVAAVPFARRVEAVDVPGRFDVRPRASRLDWAAELRTLARFAWRARGTHARPDAPRPRPATAEGAPAGAPPLGDRSAVSVAGTTADVRAPGASTRVASGVASGAAPGAGAGAPVDGAAGAEPGSRPARGERPRRAERRAQTGDLASSIGAASVHDRASAAHPQPGGEAVGDGTARPTSRRARRRAAERAAAGATGDAGARPSGGRGAGRPDAGPSDASLPDAGPPDAGLREVGRADRSPAAGGANAARRTPAPAPDEADATAGAGGDPSADRPGDEAPARRRKRRRRRGRDASGAPDAAGADDARSDGVEAEGADDGDPDAGTGEGAAVAGPRPRTDRPVDRGGPEVGASPAAGASGTFDGAADAAAPGRGRAAHRGRSAPDGGALDAGALDAGAPDAGALDAGALDAGALDRASAAAGVGGGEADASSDTPAARGPRGGPGGDATLPRRLFAAGGDTADRGGDDAADDAADDGAADGPDDGPDDLASSDGGPPGAPDAAGRRRRRKRRRSRSAQRASGVAPGSAPEGAPHDADAPSPPAGVAPPDAPAHDRPPLSA